MAEVEIHDNRKRERIIASGILSITKKEEGKVLLRLDSGYTIEMSVSPIAQVLAASKLNDEEPKGISEEITLVEYETLVVTDVRLKKEVAVGNVINCYSKAYACYPKTHDTQYLITLKLDTGYSVGLELKPRWLDKIFGGEDEY